MLGLNSDPGTPARGGYFVIRDGVYVRFSRDLKLPHHLL
ncbi:hypothetical protein BN77_1514 [Rhizobium mesoamericanum STM3625]|uniref:Uncharacterized protein n=1 Tax=Rhizobium mesoamericanum STM3625 TaxID=1211777 RepID=K0PKD5_9HYPH|nr:hypothetical protein BN77_1514 [Rhizobium mesoamericanum STM3625]